MSSLSTKIPGHALIAGAGFVGESLARQLMSAGWKVTAITRHAESALKLQSKYPSSAFHATALDLTDSESVTQFAHQLPSPPDLVFHTASSSRGGIEAYEKIFLLTPALLMLKFPETPFLFCSSTSVYGQRDGSHVDETSPAEPTSATSKILIEAEHQILSHATTPGSVFRLAGLYGPGRAHLLWKWANGEACIDGENEEADGRYLNQLHVEDAASALLWVGSRPELLTRPAPERLWNVVDDQSIKQRSFYESLLPFIPQEMERVLPPIKQPDPHRKRGWTDKCVSNEKLKSTGWKPLYPNVPAALLLTGGLETYLTSQGSSI